jgi:magnesium transporter
VITVNVHTTGRGLQNDLPLDQISDILERGQGLLWIDVIEPTEHDIRLLAEEFAFHPLAIEDATRRHQRPKVDFYDDFLFIVFYAIELRDGRPQPVEIALFAGKNYLVTIHDGSLPVFDETAKRLCDDTHCAGLRNVGLLVYTVLDATVDGYFPVIDEISDRIEDLETGIFEHYDTQTQQSIFTLKKDLLAVRRVLAPERDVMNVLVRRDVPVFGDEPIVYFQDVYDHILRVLDAVDTYRDLLSSALDLHLSVTSNRLNQIMKRLTASSILLMSVTLIAGIYGMNFDFMPELHWRLGYLWALGLMLLVGGTLFTIFRRQDWL